MGVIRYTEVLQMIKTYYVPEPLVLEEEEPEEQEDGKKEKRSTEVEGKPQGAEAYQSDEDENMAIADMYDIVVDTDRNAELCRSVALQLTWVECPTNR